MDLGMMVRKMPARVVLTLAVALTACSTGSRDVMMESHVLSATEEHISCGVGDCLIGPQFLSSSVVHSDLADEGPDPPYEDPENNVPGEGPGVCVTGCSTVSQEISIVAQLSPTTEVHGRCRGIGDCIIGSQVLNSSVVGRTWPMRVRIRTRSRKVTSLGWIRACV